MLTACDGSDRPDVKAFFALQYHNHISKAMLSLSESLGAEWQPRMVLKLLFWLRTYDTAIARAVGSSDTAECNTLANDTVWNQALAGFTSLSLPSFSGWVTKQTSLGNSTEWERVWAVIENVQIKWFGRAEDASDEHEATAATGDCIELTADTTVTVNDEDSIIKVSGLADTSSGVVYFKLDEDLYMQFQKCLSESISPRIQGESGASEVDQVSEALRAAGQKLMQEYKEKTKEEQAADVAVRFETAFATMLQTVSSRISEADPEDASELGGFTLTDGLAVLTSLLDEMVDLVDGVLFFSDADEDRKLAHEVIRCNAHLRHKQFERYIVRFCEPLPAPHQPSTGELPVAAVPAVETTLSASADLDVIQMDHMKLTESASSLADLGDEGEPNVRTDMSEEEVVKKQAPAILDGCATRHNVGDLLRWCRDYTSRIASLGITEEEMSDSASFAPLQLQCRTPMAEYIAAVQAEIQGWLEGIRRVEALSVSDEGKPTSSLAADLFGMIARTTTTAAQTGSSWLLVNTVEGVVVPCTRLWAAAFKDELEAVAQVPAALGDYPLGLVATNGDDNEDGSQVKGVKYFCALLSTIEHCHQLCNSWADELEDTLHSSSTASDWEDESASGTMQLSTGMISAALRELNEVVVQCVVSLLMLGESPVHQLLSHVSSPAWVEQSMTEQLTDALQEAFGEQLHEWVSKRVRRKVLDLASQNFVKSYNWQLLSLAMSARQRKRARRGKKHTRRHGELAAFINADVDRFYALFTTGLGLKDVAVRTSLQLTIVLAELFGCDIEEFLPTVLSNAFNPDFTLEMVAAVLSAREDVHQTQRDELILASSERIHTVQETLNPSLPPRADRHQQSVEAAVGGTPRSNNTDNARARRALRAGTVASPESAVVPAEVARLQALHRFTAKEKGDISFEAGDIIVVTDNQAGQWTWWQGYVTQLANGTQLPQPDVTMARPASASTSSPCRPIIGIFPPNFTKVFGGADEPAVVVPLVLPGKKAHRSWFCCSSC